MVPKGSFVAFSVDEVHMDPRVYEAPEEFNPGRFLRGGAGGKGEGKGPHEYVGWGSGRHPCGKFFLSLSRFLFLSQSPSLPPILTLSPLHIHAPLEMTELTNWC